MTVTTPSTIEDVARRLGLPTRAQRIPCPRHPGRAPAAILDVLAGRFRCPLCHDVEGDAVDLVALVKGLGRREAREWLARGTDDDALLVYETFLRTVVSHGKDFEAERQRLGASRETLRRLGARFVADYRATMLAMMETFPLPLLRASGLFNRRGHLVFYRHRLVLPFRDGGRPVHLVGLGPGELHLRGRPVPVPFNLAALTETRGEVVLCASVRDAILLEEWGCPAVAIPEPPGLRVEWHEHFAGRTVLVLADGASGGRQAAKDRASALKSVAAAVDIVELPGREGAAGLLRVLGREGDRVD
jgi:hypothetical protein